jgi:hypothetical protein
MKIPNKQGLSTVFTPLEALFFYVDFQFLGDFARKNLNPPNPAI